jgi:hypothetical protein
MTTFATCSGGSFESAKGLKIVGRLWGLFSDQLEVRLLRPSELLGEL